MFAVGGAPEAEKFRFSVMIVQKIALIGGFFSIKLESVIRTVFQIIVVFHHVFFRPLRNCGFR